MIVKTIFQSSWFQFYDSLSEYQCPVDLLTGDKYFTRNRVFVQLQTASTVSFDGIFPFQLSQKAEVSLSISIYLVDLVFITNKMACIY